MRLPVSKPNALKSPGTPLYFASPNSSMTPTPKWQEKLKLKSKMKAEFAALPPVFQKQSTAQRWSMMDGDTDDTDSIYGSSEELEFDSTDDNEAREANKSAYENVKKDTRKALRRASLNSDSKLSLLHRGGSQKGSFCIDPEEEATPIHGSVTSIEYLPNEDGLAEYLFQKSLSREKGEESKQETPKQEARKGNKNSKPVFKRSGSQRSFNRGKVLDLRSPKPKKEEEEEENENSKPVFRRSGSQRSFYDEEDAELNSFHGSVTQIEYINGEDGIAEYVYQKAQKQAEIEVLKTPVAQREPKRISGYNFLEMLLSDDDEEES